MRAHLCKEHDVGVRAVEVLVAPPLPRAGHARLHLHHSRTHGAPLTGGACNGTTGAVQVFHVVPDLLEADESQARILKRPPVPMVLIAPRYSDHGILCQPCANCRHPRHDVREALALVTEQEETGDSAELAGQRYRMKCWGLEPLSGQMPSTGWMQLIYAVKLYVNSLGSCPISPGCGCGRVGVGWREEGTEGKGEDEGIADGAAPRQRS